MLKVALKVSLAAALGSFIVGCAPGSGGGAFVHNKSYRGPAVENFSKTPLPVNIPGRIVTESMDINTRNRLRETTFVADNTRSSQVTHKNPNCNGSIKYEGNDGENYYFIETLEPSYTNTCPPKSMVVIAIDPTIKNKNQFFYGRYTLAGKMVEKGFAYRK